MNTLGVKLQIAVTLVHYEQTPWTRNVDLRTAILLDMRDNENGRLSTGEFSFFIILTNNIYKQ